jgi:hypothetical protein
MLFGETVAACCENHMEHTNTLCGQNDEFSSVNACAGFEAVTAMLLESCCFLHAYFMPGLLFEPKDGGDVFFRKVG